MVKVKICGITNIQDANAAVRAGCDALGFVFARKSPRYIRPEKAREIIRQLPGRLITIGVFVNARAKTVKRIARTLGLTMLQFHGDESAQFCDRFKRYKVIKAFGVRAPLDLSKVRRYRTFAYLFDAFSSRARGGTGKTLNWSFLAQGLRGVKASVFLAGGLNAGNVTRAMRRVRPDWVDASSCLETRPGKKDYSKMRGFIRRAKAFTR